MWQLTKKAGRGRSQRPLRIPDSLTAPSRPTAEPAKLNRLEIAHLFGFRLLFKTIFRLLHLKRKPIQRVRLHKLAHSVVTPDGAPTQLKPVSTDMDDARMVSSMRLVLAVSVLLTSITDSGSFPEGWGSGWPLFAGYVGHSQGCLYSHCGNSL
jgi:hypothetical protein